MIKNNALFDVPTTQLPDYNKQSIQFVAEIYKEMHPSPNIIDRK
jgi:hypothetical protein